MVNSVTIVGGVSFADVNPIGKRSHEPGVAVCVSSKDVTRWMAYRCLSS